MNMTNTENDNCHAENDTEHGHCKWDVNGSEGDSDSNDGHDCGDIVMGRLKRKFL